MTLSTQKTSSKAKRKENEKYQTLYGFWESLPNVTFIEITGKNYKSHPVRPAIMAILREGIIDEEDSKEAKGKRRYGLNSQEILDLLNEKDEKIRGRYGLNDEKLRDFIPISKTNLYFHLDKLEKAGFIKEIAKILEGRHKVAYYGRTSRIFYLEDSIKALNYYRELLNEFAAFSELQGKKVDLENLDLLAKDYVEKKGKRKQDVAERIAQHEKLIHENKLDLTKIIDAAYLIDSINPDITKTLKKINEVFQGVMETII